MTEAEITKWGQSVSLSLLCYQYSDLTLSLLADGKERLDGAVVRKELPSHPVWQTLFNQAASYLTSNGLITDERINSQVEFGIRGEPHGLVLAGKRIILMEFSGRARVVVQDAVCPLVEAYGAPREGTKAIIERFALGETSIVHDRDRVAILIDISQIALPPLCQFRFVKTGGDHEIDVESFELRGVEKLAVARGNVHVNIGTHDDNSPTIR